MGFFSIVVIANFQVHQMRKKKKLKVAVPLAPHCLHSYCNTNFDYCSVHVSTVISHVSQQFRFLVFFIATVRMNFMHFVIAMVCVNIIETFWNSCCSCQHGMSRLPQCALNVPSDQMMMENLEKNGFHHQHRARSYSCVNLGWLNGVTQYWSRNLCGFAYYRSTESSMSYGHHTSLVVRVAISAFVLDSESQRQHG
ncbi:hypothetical protein Tsp_07004 [Trichinella spiralis]|uniref:hypothetical protein n=1 Tax=Trichinella spiralis TaxID=6334 RepID=UPI0001EFB45C|nr:hypothetical protein Tsp_07004 [Trichinella spiralis]